MFVRKMTGVVLAAALAALPAFAQNNGTPATGSAAPASPTVGSTATGAAPDSATPGTGMAGTGMANPAGGLARTGTSEPNPALANNGDVRASKVIGAAVYNDKNQKIGSVDDVLLDKDRKATQAVISVGGVLGVGAKLVAVPYEKLTFPAEVGDTMSRVMMPGATENALNGMPTFHYASK